MMLLMVIMMVMTTIIFCCSKQVAWCAACVCKCVRCKRCVCLLLTLIKHHRKRAKKQQNKNNKRRHNSWPKTSFFPIALVFYWRFWACLFDFQLQKKNWKKISKKKKVLMNWSIWVVSVICWCCYCCYFLFSFIIIHWKLFQFLLIAKVTNT